MQMMPERTEAQEDRAYRAYCGEPEKCIDCHQADTCENVGEWCYRDDAEQARWEGKLDEMRGKGGR
ncbi:MAG: hypothetical protein PHZ19_10980 [Candidatus Thermoplasmatota archaeon]|nr:hypothetical protein [Candidatus Thermoplasmatota archaeon]